MKQFENFKRLESRNCSAEVVCRSCQRLSRSRSKFRRRTNHQWCSGRSPLELDLLEATQGHYGASLFTCILCTTVLLWHGWMPPHLCVIYPGSWLYRSSSGPRRRHSHSAYHWFHRPSKSFRRYPAPRAVGPRSDPYCKGCASFMNLRWIRKYCQQLRSHLCRCEFSVFDILRFQFSST